MTTNCPTLRAAYDPKARMWHFTADNEIAYRVIDIACADKAIEYNSCGFIAVYVRHITETILHSSQAAFCPQCFKLGKEAFKQMEHDKESAA